MTTAVKIAVKKSIRPLLLAAAAGLLATGCSTYEQQNKVIVYWQQGRLTNAVIEAGTMATNNAKNKDAIIWRLEQGAVLRANGQYKDSNKAFNEAEAKIDAYEQAAKLKVGHEAGALLSNQAELPYEGRAYDAIMLDTYKALNYLALGDIEKARPAIIRAYQRQQDAVEENKRRIEKLQEEQAKSKDKAAMEKAQNNDKFKSAISTNYAKLDQLKAYADYVNPFTVYLDGLYFMANATDASDLERAHKSFERVNSFIGDNDYIKQDLAAVDGLMKGQPLTPTTYVIFETGCAPTRGQVRIDIPIIVSKVSYVGAAFPTLKFQDNYVQALVVTAGGTNESTASLASMDSVIGLEFKNEMPMIITKTIASTVTKAVAAYAANEASRQAGGDIAGLFSQLATAAYQMAVNIADTRTWTTLPKEFQFCRIQTPADRKIELSTADGLHRTTVTVGDGLINLVYVKSITPLTPLVVSQCKLTTASPVVAVTRTVIENPAPAPASTNAPATPAATTADTSTNNVTQPASSPSVETNAAPAVQASENPVPSASTEPAPVATK